MGQTTNLQATAIQFLEAAELLLTNGDFARAESAVNASLKIIPGDRRALAMLDRILRKDAVDIRAEHESILESVSSVLSGPFTAGSGARHGRFLPHEVPDDGKEEAISVARRHESSENWTKAAAAWLEVLSTDPSDTWAWTQYAHLLSANLHDYEKAEVAYRKALDVDPTDDWAWGKLGIMLADFAGKVSEGQEMLRRAIELDPNEAYYKAWLGWSLCYQSEDPVEAEQYLSAAVKALPSYQWAWFHLAYVLSTQEGRHKESREAYQKSLKLAPSDIASHFNLGILYQEVFNQYKQSLKCFTKVITLNPEDSASWRRIAFLQRDQFMDTGAAIEAFKKTVSLDDQDYEAWTILGHLLWEEVQEMEASLTAINKALRIKDDSPWIWCHLGDYYCFGVQDYGSAEVAYRKALEINGRFDWALAHLGALLLDHNNQAIEAETYLQKAVDVSPNYIFALRELLNCKQSLGRADEETAKILKMILDVEPDDIDSIIDYAKLLGEKLGQPEEGLVLFKNALNVDPDNFSLQWTFLYYCIYTLGRAHEAEPVIAALEECGETEMLIACFLGSYYANAEGDVERANIWHNQAIKISPDEHFAVHEYGAFLLYHRKDYLKAADVLSQAALLDTDNCIGLEGDLILIQLFLENEFSDKEKAMAWTKKVLADETPMLEDYYNAFLVLVLLKKPKDALALSVKMETVFPVSYKAWLARLVCLILTQENETLIMDAREKVIAYKPSWVDLDEVLSDIIALSDMTGS